MYSNFEETNIVSILMNRVCDIWDEVKIISKYKNGLHGEEWQGYTISENMKIQLNLAAAWIRLGLSPQDRVAIMAVNRPRWIFTIHSLLTANLVTVPVYPTLTAEEAAFILRDSGAKCVVVDTFAQANKIISVLDSLPDLQGIYIMDKLEQEPDSPISTFDALLESAPEQVDAERVYAWLGANASGHAVPANPNITELLCERIRRITPEDMAAIIYTSGTTGQPKGVVLTHRNFLSQRPLQRGLNVGRDDIFLNHLPFCHSFGLTTDLFGSLEVQATLVIADGIQPEQIRHALHTIRPTVLMSVPRFFEKIYMQVQQVVEQRPKLAQWLLESSVGTGTAAADLVTAGRTVPLWLRVKYRLSRVITNKVLRQVGLDRVRLAFVGGAPAGVELFRFFQGLGISIFQGYGLTETSPAVTLNLPGNNKLGTVGLPISGVEMKTAEDGEILIRGECVMKGYFENPAATDDVIDSDGWFHTGDMGKIDQDGYLRIVDRKKELIITSGGKNIAPLALESAFNTDRYIDHIVLVGEGRHYLTALVFPDFGRIREWAAAKGLACRNNQEIASHPEVRKLLEERIADVNERFARFEQIKKFAILEQPLTIEGGEITPTEKLKRQVIAERYRSVIDGMYA